ncbi:hypothetical protein ACFS3C_15975 [Azotobacter vinelandii]
MPLLAEILSVLALLLALATVVGVIAPSLFRNRKTGEAPQAPVPAGVGLHRRARGHDPRRQPGAAATGSSGQERDAGGHFRSAPRRRALAPGVSAGR